MTCKKVWDSVLYRTSSSEARFKGGVISDKALDNEKGRWNEDPPEARCRRRGATVSRAGVSTRASRTKTRLPPPPPTRYNIALPRQRLHNRNGWLHCQRREKGEGRDRRVVPPKRGRGGERSVPQARALRQPEARG